MVHLANKRFKLFKRNKVDRSELVEHHGDILDDGFLNMGSQYSVAVIDVKFASNPLGRGSRLAFCEGEFATECFPHKCDYGNNHLAPDFRTPYRRYRIIYKAL